MTGNGTGAAADRAAAQPPQKKGPGVKYSVEVSNPYGVLSEEEGRRKIGVKTFEEPLEPESKKTRLPPIQVPVAFTEVDGKTTQQPDPAIVRQVVAKLTNEFNIKNDTAELKIFTSNQAIHEQIKKGLLSKSIGCFSHPSNQRKPKRFVLYGLPKMEPDSIRQLLTEAGISPTRINFMSTNAPRFADQCNYLLEFDGSSPTSLNSLKDTRALNHTIVNWANYRRKKSNVSPCRNCCAFGHGGFGCDMPSICIICAGAHDYKNCKFLIKKHEGQFDRISDRHIKCANCGGNHTATFAECQARLTYIKNLSEKKNTANTTSQEQQNQKKPKQQKQQRQPPARDLNNFPAPVFANPIYNQPIQWAQNPTNSSTNNNNNNNHIRDSELYSMAECQQMMNNLYSSLQKCTSKQQQAKVIADYAFTYFCNF